jgi:phenylalanyl-tRNA synthetase beta chain
MKVSLKWLASYVNLTLPPRDLARRLTLSTTEVESIEQTGAGWKNVSVGEVVAVAPHPNADRLRLASVQTGSEIKTVVCGAPNIAAGQKIAFARAGANLIDGHTRKPTVLKTSKIRGVESEGMVCSERELGLSDEHEGILVLAPDAPVGTPLADYLGDTVLDLYNWPHRPDLMSMIGVAREVAALTHQPLREPDLSFGATDAGADRFSVTVEAPDLCARYVMALIENVAIEPSPAWMQERLLAAGMRPINTVVDITNYVMLEYGQPLHAFDYDRVAEQRVSVRRAAAGERLLTLDGVDRELDDSMLVIADPRGPIGLAGVMGGANSEIHEGTRRILLESANFNGINIRKTSTRLGLRSEASMRFEKGIGAELAMLGARRAVQLMVELAGGRASAGFADAYPGQRPPIAVSLSEQRIRQVLGIDVEPTTVRRTLQGLGFTVEGGPPEAYRVSVPYWRTDIHLPDDLVEEIIRIIGYDTIPLTTISGRVPALVAQPMRDLRLRVQDLLVDAGMQEVITYSLIGSEMLDKVGADADATLRVVHPASSEHVYLRTELRGSLLSVLAANLRHRRLLTPLFETARVYLPRAGELPVEDELAVGVIAGERPDRWGMPDGESVDFFDLKGIVEAVLDRLGIAASYTAAEDPLLMPGRTARILAGEVQLGVIGQVHPHAATRFDLEQPAFLFELRLEALLPLLGTSRHYAPVSRYPEVRFDRSIVVPEDVTAGQVAQIIRRGRNVVEVRPFDVFRGGNVPEGSKAVAFSVSFQAPDRTLTDEEAVQSWNRIERQLDRELNARPRESL